MTRTVVCANTKGGPGKTTVAWNLINHWAAEGKRVLAIDSDPQGTLIAWYAAREEKDGIGGEVVALKDLEGSIKRRVARGDYDLIVVDTPGRLQELAPAFRIADVIVCPVQPTDADYHAFQRTFAAIERERAGERVYIVPNRVKTPNQSDEIRATLPAVSKGKARVASVNIGDWVKLQQETLGGLSAVDLAREDDKERRAIKAIAKEIERMSNGRH